VHDEPDHLRWGKNVEAISHLATVRMALGDPRRMHQLRMARLRGKGGDPVGKGRELGGKSVAADVEFAPVARGEHGEPDALREGHKFGVRRIGSLVAPRSVAMNDDAAND